jgi:hypothetical protein
MKLDEIRVPEMYDVVKAIVAAIKDGHKVWGGGCQIASMPGLDQDKPVFYAQYVNDSGQGERFFSEDAWETAWEFLHRHGGGGYLTVESDH